jgi:hypothetical protein
MGKLLKSSTFQFALLAPILQVICGKRGVAIPWEVVMGSGGAYGAKEGLAHFGKRV